MRDDDFSLPLYVVPIRVTYAICHTKQIDASQRERCDHVLYERTTTTPTFIFFPFFVLKLAVLYSINQSTLLSLARERVERHLFYAHTRDDAKLSRAIKMHVGTRTLGISDNSGNTLQRT